MILLPLGLLLGLIAAWLWRAPRLLAVWPAPNSTVPAGAPLRLTFSRPMRSAALISRLSLSPAQQGRWEEAGNTLVFTPDEPWPGGVTVTVRLAGGAWSADSLPAPLLSGRSWSFAIQKPRLLYLWPANGRADLYAIDPLTGSRQQLTNVGGVRDFSLSADGLTVYFSADNPSGGADLFRLSRLDGALATLLECGVAVCQAVCASPDGRWLAYERSAADEPTRVWLTPLSGGPPVLAGNPTHQTFLPSWSPGNQLAFYDLTSSAFVILEPQSGATVSFANETGAAGDWSADGSWYVAPEISLLPAAGGEPLAISHLMAYDPARRNTLDLTQSANSEDTAPAFSPDGQWLAFARKSLDAERWTPGRQVWVMRADGKDPVQLTNAPFYNHYDFAWSTESRQLAFVRSNLDNPTESLELWLMNADGSQAVRLAVGAYAPCWAP